MLRIGPLSLGAPVVLAPMAGVTNAPFRALCRRAAGVDVAGRPQALFVSEMITARALVEGNAKTELLASFGPDETIRSLQLYGTDPGVIGEAVRRLVGEGRVDHLDLNFGCPVPKVTRHGGGAALPVRRRLLAAILRAAVGAAGRVPVTAKFRIGVDDDHVTFLDTGRIAEAEGCAAVALHARTAHQLYSGSARWAAIGELKAGISSIPVLGNGDIWAAEDALAMMEQTGCDGVVVGRGCLGRPWLFADLAAAMNGEPTTGPPDLGATAATMVEHLGLLRDWLGDEGRAAREFRKHTGWYLKGYPVGNDVRDRLARLESCARLSDELSALDPTARLTPEGVRARRGHTQGPRPVALPDGWYDTADSDAPLDLGAELATSGG